MAVIQRGGAKMTVVWTDVHEVEERLKKLGLSPEGTPSAVENIDTVLQRAEAERNFCTGLDPISLPGNIFWGRTVRFLRETYLPHGWTAASPRNVPLLVAPSEEFAITVSSGSRETGFGALKPTTRYSKGTAVMGRVATNRQLLIPGVGFGEEDVEVGDGIPTWFLLYQHVSTKSGVRLHAELSLPEGAGEHGKIDVWNERIILPEIDFDGFTPFEDAIDPNSGFDIPVERLG
ncbi:hypothetical protein [Kitasatospora sp. NPDC056273]|uniref:hypothetical protein n=1 Tax=unclassified Kitasatospora TaxID=2633591 RepID=UPI0035E04AA1